MGKDISVHSMKSALLSIGLSLLMILSISIISNAQNLLNEPESVVYDSTLNRYIVSNYGDGAFVQIDSNGDQSYFNEDLMPGYNCLGLHIKDNNLYASVNGLFTGIGVFNLASGNLDTIISVPGIFINDITSDTSGHLYVTDFDFDKIFKIRLSDFNVSLFVNSGLSTPNGIFFDAFNNRLLVSNYISSSNNPLIAVNLQDSTLFTIIDFRVPVDGLTMDDERNLYFSSWSPIKYIDMTRII